MQQHKQSIPIIVQIEFNEPLNDVKEWVVRVADRNSL